MPEFANTAAGTHWVVTNACVHKATESLKMEEVVKVKMLLDDLKKKNF